MLTTLVIIYRFTVAQNHTYAFSSTAKLAFSQTLNCLCTEKHTPILRLDACFRNVAGSLRRPLSSMTMKLNIIKLSLADLQTVTGSFIHNNSWICTIKITLSKKRKMFQRQRNKAGRVTCLLIKHRPLLVLLYLKKLRNHQKNTELKRSVLESLKLSKTS